MDPKNHRIEKDPNIWTKPLLLGSMFIFQVFFDASKFASWTMDPYLAASHLALEPVRASRVDEKPLMVWKGNGDKSKRSCLMRLMDNMDKFFQHNHSPSWIPGPRQCMHSVSINIRVFKLQVPNDSNHILYLLCMFFVCWWKLDPKI